MSAMSVAKSDLMSESPSNSRGEFGNTNMSGFSIGTVDVEELRS